MINSRDIKDLHPKLQELCGRHINACRMRGVTIQVTNTLRDAEYQAYLYSLGRTKPGSKVTNAELLGPHGFGLAYDIVPVADGKALWDNDRLWAIAGEEGKRLGLTWGGDWKSIVDKPHFEYTSGLKAAQLRAGKRPLWWEVKQLGWKEIIRQSAADPEGWIEDIEAMVKAAEAEGNIGSFEKVKYFPLLIEKVYNSRG